MVEHAIILRKGAEMTEHGAGWTILYPFDPSSSGRLRDTSESDKGGRGGSSSADQQPLPCYQGSPLALMQLSPPYDRSQYLQRSGATLVYSLRTHRALKPAAFLLSPDVFYSSAPPLPGLMPQREGGGRDARLVPCPLGRVESRSLQMQCKLSATQIRLTIPASLEAEAAKLAFQQHAPPPARGARPQQPPAKIATGQRRLLLALHSSYLVCSDKSQTLVPPPAPTADGRQVTPPAGSLVAPKSIALEEVRGDRSAPPGSLVLKPQGSASASTTLDGFVNSSSLALVFELQVEVTLPPPPGRYERRVKWVPLAWGCHVPCADRPPASNALPSFPMRARLELRFGASGKPSPLSYERLPGGGAALAAVLGLAPPSSSSSSSSSDPPYAEVEINVPPGTNLKQMERELDSADAEDAALMADEAARDAASSLTADRSAAALAAAEKAFAEGYVTAVDSGGGADDGRERDRSREDDRRASSSSRLDPARPSRDASPPSRGRDRSPVSSRDRGRGDGRDDRSADASRDPARRDSSLSASRRGADERGSSREPAERESRDRVTFAKEDDRDRDRRSASRDDPRDRRDDSRERDRGRDDSSRGRDRARDDRSASREPAGRDDRDRRRDEPDDDKDRGRSRRDDSPPRRRSEDYERERARAPSPPPARREREYDLPPSSSLSAQEAKADAHYKKGLKSLHKRSLLAWRGIAALSKACLRKALGRVDLHVHTLRLVNPPDPRYNTLWVTISPLLTVRPLGTKRLGRASGRADSAPMGVDFAESLELLPNSLAAKKLTFALASEMEMDSTLVYTLWGSGVGNDDDSILPPEALAQGSLSLRGLWSSGADLVRSALPLFAQRQEVAELTITIHALHAIRAVTAPPKGGAGAAAEAGGAATAEGRPGRPPAAPSAVTSSAAGATALPLPGSQQVASMASPPIFRSSAEAAMAELVAAGAGAPFAQVAPVVGGMAGPAAFVADRADRAMLWKASMRLGQTPMDASGAPFAQAGSGQPPPRMAEDANEFGIEMAHNILLQFVCFSTDEPTPPESIYLSFTLFHFDQRTTPRALLMSSDDAQAAASRAAAVASGTAPHAGVAAGRDASGGLARPDAIVVEVRELALGPKSRDAPWSHLAIEIEIPGVDPPPPPPEGYPSHQPLPKLVCSPNAAKRGRRVDFGFSHAFETPPGSSASSNLARLLGDPRGNPDGPGRVRFYLKAPVGRDGRMEEVADGELGLEAILSDRKDALNVPVQLNSRNDFVGSLTVSVHALSALNRAQAEAKAASADALEGGGGVGGGLGGFGERGGTGKEEDWMLVAADSALAKEGPGLVERFLIQPPGVEEVEQQQSQHGGGGAGGGGGGVAAERGRGGAPTAATAARSDGEAFAQVQSERFQRYLQSKCVTVDVWNGASLLQIGTARVPLAALLKKGDERVGAASVTKEYLTVDVLDTALTTIDAAPSADAEAVVTPALRGKLKLVIARLSSAVPALKKAQQQAAAAAAAGARARSASPPRGGGGGGAASEAGTRQKVRTRALTDASSGVANAQVSAREPTAAEEAALYRKQLRRQKQREWLRFGGGSASVAPGPPGQGGQSVSRSAEGLFGARGGPGGTAGGAPGSVARSLELGMGDEHSLSRARLQLQQRSLRVAESYRSSHREERLRFLLADQASLTRYVYPSYGSAELVELPFRNPYSEPHSFTIDWDDALGHVSLVSSADEWRSLKALHNLHSTPVEEGLLLNGTQLWLQAHELVYVPIKYQGWQHGQVTQQGGGGGGGGGAGEAADGGYSAPTYGSGSATAAMTAAMPLGRRTLTIRVLNVKSETVGALELRVRPQPYVIDQTFRFHQSEHEFLKTTIRLAPVRWYASSALPQPPAPSSLTQSQAAVGSGGYGLATNASAASLAAGAVWVRASDPNVQCGVHERKSPVDPLEVFIKFKCGASPAVTRFLVLVYDDPYMHRLLETWELVVHALQRVDVHALVGQTSLAKALLRGESRAAHGLVQCFSSDPRELRLNPNAPFPLSGGGLTEVNLALRPVVPGRRQYVVHAVDLSRRALLSSWLVCAVNRLPALTKAFALTVPAALGAKKKVSIANPYSYETTYTFYTDMPHLLKFSSPQVRLGVGESKYIGLQFVPLAHGRAVAGGATRLLVFVNNEEDKNEECMEVTVSYA